MAGFVLYPVRLLAGLSLVMVAVAPPLVVLPLPPPPPPPPPPLPPLLESRVHICARYWDFISRFVFYPHSWYKQNTRVLLIVVREYGSNLQLIKFERWLRWSAKNIFQIRTAVYLGLRTCHRACLYFA